MELKVWVDGIQRVVCGVTDNTTCQDIVIALAQAMGRTGRFTLIEKWRENERPLSPADCPLLVLQKWGEFASEVKLILYESGTRRKLKQAEKRNEVQKDPDRFSHNFTPPVKTSDAVIRRSLTFSGGRKQDPGTYGRKPDIRNDFPRQASSGSQGFGSAPQHRHLQVPEKVMSDGNSFSSSSSLSSHNSAALPQQPQSQPRRRRSSSHDRVTSAQRMTSSSHDLMTSSSNDPQRPTYPQHSQPSPQYSMNGPQLSNRQPQFSQSNKQFLKPGPQISSQGQTVHQIPSHRGAAQNSIPGVSSSIPDNFTFQNHKQPDSVPNGPVRYQAPMANGPSQHQFPTANGPSNLPSPPHGVAGQYNSRETLNSPIHSPALLNGPLYDRNFNSGAGYNSHKANSPVSRQPNSPVSKTQLMNGPVTSQAESSRPGYSSAFVPVQKMVDRNDPQRISDSNMDIPIYTDSRKSSHKHELEEYDLDSNFPDVVKETGKDRLIEEFHVPGSKGQGHQRNLMSREEEERVKLLRLVTMQNERIKMQDSQLEIIDTEISSREQKMEDLKLEIDRVTEEIRKLSKLNEEKTEEINKLDNGTLIDEIEQEKQNEREIKNEITALKSRLQKCESDLRQFQSKVQTCSKELENEKDVIKADEKRRREEEVKLQAELTELKKEVDSRSNDLEKKTKEFSSVEKELENITDALKKKEDDLMTTQKELERENLKFFHPPQSVDGTNGPGTKEGEAILKVLEGSLTPKLKRNKLIASPLTILEMTKKESGVWV